MKRMLSRSLVLSLCLLLSLPAVADAFIFGRSAPKFAITLSVDNAKPGSVIATVTDARGNPAPGQNVAFTWQVRGEPGGPQPGPITATNAIGQTTYIQENWSVVGSIITVTAILQSDPSITATADIAARFIAQSESPMNWNDAKAFCARHGGRLPRIQGRDSFSGSEFQQMFEAAVTAAGLSLAGVNAGHVGGSKIAAAIAAAGILIDGFGAMGRPWAEVGLPAAEYWSGTELSDDPGGSWVVFDNGGFVNVTSIYQGDHFWVVCVP